MIDANNSRLTPSISRADKGGLKPVYKQLAKVGEHAIFPNKLGRTMGIPDEQIFPHATGAAARTVEQHQEPQELIFYAGWVRIPLYMDVLRSSQLESSRYASSARLFNAAGSR